VPSDTAQVELDRRSRQVTEHLGRTTAVYEGLRKECELLATHFRDLYGAAAYSQKKAVPSYVTRFFLQVCGSSYHGRLFHLTVSVDRRRRVSAPNDQWRCLGRSVQLSR
jgi:hypothetical protein